ncbi:MAG TPA: hypothetical protein PK429_00940 [Candidatus Pacearchaeota archaeon]|nr:hypothetical protein [Candidatus Pacearchaeota archaeon]
MNPNRPTDHFRRIDKKFLFGFAALAIAGLCLWQGGLFSAGEADAKTSASSFSGYVGGNIRRSGGITYIRYTGVRPVSNSPLLSNLMRAAGTIIDGEGGWVSEDDYAMIVAAVVDVLFENASGNFLDNFTEKLVASFGSLPEDKGQKLAERLNKYYDTHPEEMKSLGTAFAVAKMKVDSEGQTKEGLMEEYAWGNAIEEGLTTQRYSDEEIKGMGYSDKQTDFIKETLEQHPDWSVDDEYFYVDRDGNGKRNSGDLVMGGDDGYALTVANETLDGRPTSDPSKSACEWLGDSSMDPYGSGGINEEGTGLLGSGTTPPSSNTNANTNTNTNANVKCTSYNYSAWSTCAGGQQTRTITGQSPAGCTDTSSAILTQTCTVSGNVACTAYDYSAWSVCAGGQQTRTITGQSPAGCTDTSSAELTQTCTVSGNVACTAYNYSAWSVCAGGQQTRTITGQSPSGCTDTSSAELTQTCTMPAGACVSYTYSDWSACADGRQTRTVVSRSPEGCDAASAILEQTCLTPCVSYNYGDWSACVAGQQTRAIISRSPENCDASSAVFTQPCVAPESPVVENTTNAVQSDSSAALSVITDRPADCQYNSAGGFSFGAGTDFSATGSYFHNAALANVTAGEKTYYVICKDKATGGLSEIIKIDFRVESSAAPDETCAELSANDRKNNAQRSWSDTATADSVYLWQSIRLGREESFDKVDWYAGYQFTPQRDGRANQVCGYFKSGSTNKVSIYNGSYNELGGAQISGTGGWKCVDIAPVEIKTDKRYYVIARIEDGPVYLDNKPGMLPRSAANALVEAGIRQSAAEGAFGNKVIKYDHSVLGLVDVRIAYTPETATGPIIASLSPQGTVNTADVRLAAESSAAADCRFGRDDIGYAQMSYEMAEISDGSFGKKVCGLENGAYTFYVRCRSSAGQENNFSKTIQFNVAQ